MSSTNLNQAIKFKGNVLLFYCFDIGDEIDLNKIKSKNLLVIKPVSPSPYFKDYHIPLAFDYKYMVEQHTGTRVHGEMQDYDCISSKIHPFGALSFIYKIPFQDSFDELKRKILDVKKIFDQKSISDAKNAFSKILSTIKKPYFRNLSNFYFAVQIDPNAQEPVTPEEFKEIHGSKIASLLRLELETLSEYQKKEILSAITGYSGHDMMIIDSEGAFIYDNEYFESLEFFEFANIQKMELQYFDRLLDSKLNFFYSQQSYKVPLSAYVPLLGGRLNQPVSIMARLRVDISVITERLENSIKMAGETYFSRLYTIINERFSLSDWRNSVNRKLEIIKELYTVHQDRLDVIHEEILTLVIIVLIAVEVVMALK